MAEHATPEYAVATGNDYAEHERTYHNVINLAKVGTIGAVACLISLAAYGVGGKMWLFTIGLVLTLVSIAVGLGSGRGTIKPLLGTIVVILILWAISA